MNKWPGRCIGKQVHRAILNGAATQGLLHGESVRHRLARAAPRKLPGHLGSGQSAPIRAPLNPFRRRGRYPPSSVRGNAHHQNIGALP
jgi:hypothetical protein